MNNTYLLIIIFGMFLVTYPVRFVPLLFSNRVKMPQIIKVWLGYVPTAIFAGLIVQVFYDKQQMVFNVTENIPLILSCLGAILITVRTKSIGWGLGLGFALFVTVTILYP